MSSDKIRIDTDKLDDISQQFDRLSGSLGSIESSLAQAISTAYLVIPEQPNIIRNMTSLKGRVSASNAYARRVSGAVRNASARWAEAEGTVAGQPLDQGEDPFDVNGGGEGGNSEKGFWDYFLEGLSKAIGGTGAIGKMVSALWSGFSKGNTADWIKAGADFFIGGIGKVIMEGAKGTNADWAKALFGLGEYTKTFGENMSNPISWAVNLVKSAVDNWGLVQEGNVIRFITETGSEAATNVALTAGGMALAAAAAAAVGITAPAWAVGAAGAVIVWGANSIVKELTGKNIAENVGEIVGDVTDWAVEKGEQAIDWVADKGKQLMDTGAQIITDAGNTICGFLSPLFG